MESNEKFWLGIVAMVLMFILSIIFMVIKAGAFEDTIMAKLIAEGAEPMEVFCVYDGMSMTDTRAACADLVTSKVIQNRTAD